MDFKGFYERIIFDINSTLFKTPNAKQGDTRSRGFYVTVTQNNIKVPVINESMTFYCEKPDGTRVYTHAVVDGDEFRVDLPNQVFAVPGILNCELTLMGQHGEKITSRTFKMLVHKSLADNSIVSEDERGVIDDALEFVEEYVPRLELIDIDSLEHYDSELKQNKIKISTVEKELSDYKRTIAGINVNQEAKQEASGYGIVSLPKNAANGHAGGAIYGNTIINLIEDTATSPLTIELDSGKVYLLIKSDGGTVNVDGMDTTVPATLYFLPSETTGLTSTTLIWDTGNIGLYELLDTETSKDVAELVQKYTYVSGTKSTIGSARIKSVGKNLIPDLTIANKVGVPTSMSSVSGDDGGDFEYRLHPDGVDLLSQSSATHLMLEFKGLYIPVAPDTAYVCSFSSEGGTQERFGFREFTKDKQEIGWGGYVRKNEQFTTSDDCHYITIGLGVANDSSVPMFFRKVQLERGDTATSYEPYTESNAYVVAKDSAGKITELRSLPNGTKDEIDLEQGKMIKRVSDWVTLDGSERWRGVETNYEGFYRARVDNWAIDNNALQDSGIGSGLAFDINGTHYTVGGKHRLERYIRFTIDHIFLMIEREKIDTMSGATLLDKFKSYLSQHPITLTYQLAEPEIIPVQVSGSVVSHPSGTVYIDPATTVAGVYMDGIPVTHTDLPIGELERITVIDYATGLETELDVSQAVISEDRLLFTHPDLLNGDIVFFEYEYDAETTQGETTIQYYDSRYTIKDSVTGKFYKWEITVADGVPSIELVEV